jgi:hypothetical protein
LILIIGLSVYKFAFTILLNNNETCISQVITGNNLTIYV